MSSKVVVIGAGHCAGQLVARLRQEGLEGPICMLGEEAHPPYQRPPLSKGYLAGDDARDRVLLRPPEFYAEKDIEWRMDTRVTAIDRAAKAVTLEDGSTESYDKLVITTGTRPRPLPVPGADLDGVHYLRGLDDVDAIIEGLAKAGSVAVIGGGYIGLEVAATAIKKVSKVTIVEAEPRLLSRVVAPETADFFARRHQAEGVEIMTGASAAELTGQDGRVTGVKLADGSTVAADLVVIGIGVVPNQELAAEAGLEVDDGIVVDDRGCTSDPDIFAAGDCTRHPSALYDRTLRLESVHNAMTQARVVAANLAGKEAHYNEAPWFWSDQFDIKLQIVGIADGHDQTVVRGDIENGPFSLFYLRGGKVIAADTVNDMKGHLACRKLVGAQSEADPAVLADPDQPIA